MLDLIVKAVQNVANLSDKPSGEGINADTPLMGSGRVVDSIGLVTLIVDVENRVAEETGQSVSLMDDRAMSQTRSPFRTVGSLAEYVTELTRESREIQP
jgi:acyl carrier protein